MESLYQINRRASHLLIKVVIPLLVLNSSIFADEEKPPTTRVQIINATSVPAISLAINGALDYPSFKQGLYTADAPIPTLQATYTAKDIATGVEATSEHIKYDPNLIQSLVILGDFSTQVPPGELAQPDATPSPKDKKYPPNLLFRKYLHKQVEGEVVSLRVINGMPSKRLQFTGPAGAVQVLPGGETILNQQPPIFQYSANVDGKPFDILMKQEVGIRNAMIIFYLKNGEPDFMRAFEN